MGFRGINGTFIRVSECLRHVIQDPRGLQGVYGAISNWFKGFQAGFRGFAGGTRGSFRRFSAGLRDGVFGGSNVRQGSEEFSEAFQEYLEDFQWVSKGRFKISRVSRSLVGISEAFQNH